MCRNYKPHIKSHGGTGGKQTTIGAVLLIEVVQINTIYSFKISLVCTGKHIRPRTSLSPTLHGCRAGSGGIKRSLQTYISTVEPNADIAAVNCGKCL